jgi:mannose-6-phosphate isomerase
VGSALYPLRFREILRNYGFGARWIVQVFEKDGLPEDQRIAETWEVCDRPGESSVVRSGPLAGRTLHDLISTFGTDLLGTDVAAEYGDRFPLLVKLLDCTNPLGEQVHQSDELARAEELSDPGKTEAWYMLRARPGATLRCGNVVGLTEAELRRRLVDGSVRECMQEFAAVPGEAFLLYAGTMHYSSGGVLFYEIMQNSDVVIGLRERADGLSPGERERRAEARLRAIHLEDGFIARTQPVKTTEGPNGRTYVLACRHFALERRDLRAAARLYLDGSRFHVLTVVEGTLAVTGGSRTEVLRSGQTCLLPASLGETTMAPRPEAAVLDAYVPDLGRDIVEPLRAGGFAPDEIVALGGRTELNPLRELV